jgi:phosphoribosylglycinamide formyltransferase 1
VQKIIEKIDMLPIHLAILASGSGSNAENIINYFSGRNDVEISIIISNKSEALVHKRAERMGIPSLFMAKSELEEPKMILNVFNKYQIDFVVLAGYLLRIPTGLIEAFPHRILNIHPSLLPKFGGKGMYGDKVHQAVVESGESESGITIHFINDFYDEGAIAFQTTCPVLKSDTPEDVASKVHALEYQYYPSVLDQILQKEFGQRH